jgi:hypothetical protein
MVGGPLSPRADEQAHSFQHVLSIRIEIYPRDIFRRRLLSCWWRSSLASDVRFWHKADIDFDAEHVCFRGQSGHGSRIAKCLLMTQSGLNLVKIGQQRRITQPHRISQWSEPGVEGDPRGLKTNVRYWLSGLVSPAAVTPASEGLARRHQGRGGRPRIGVDMENSWVRQLKRSRGQILGPHDHQSTLLEARHRHGRRDRCIHRN